MNVERGMQNMSDELSEFIVHSTFCIRNACLPQMKNAEWKNEEREMTSCRIHSAFSILRSAFEMAARVGFAPTPNGLTGRRATLTLPGNGELALPAGFRPA